MSHRELAIGREMLRSYFESCLGQPDDDYRCLARYWTADKVERVRDSEELRRSVFPDLHYEVVAIRGSLPQRLEILE